MNRHIVLAASVLGVAGLLFSVATAQNAPGAAAPAAGAGAGRGAGGRGGRGGAAAGAPGAPVAPMAESATDPIFRIDQNWYVRHAGLVTRAKQGNIDLYVEGDSITDNWGGAQYRDSWAKYLGGWKSANFGIGGDRTEQVLWRIKNGELDGVNPKVIVLLIGTNNLPRTQYNYSARSPEETADGVKAILAVFKEKAPTAKVLLVSVFPREDGLAGANPEDLNPKVKALNALIAKMADGKQIKFLDIYEKFLDKDGKVNASLMQPDKLHPVAAGYDVWGQAMLPFLTEWLGAPTPPAQ